MPQFDEILENLFCCDNGENNMELALLTELIKMELGGH